MSAQASESVQLRCDMRSDCTAPVSMIDDRGFAYCAPHGVSRRGGGIRCRKLTPAELRKLERGEVIAY